MVRWARRLIESAALVPLAWALLPTPSLPSHVAKSTSVARPQLISVRTTGYRIHAPLLTSWGHAKPMRLSTILAAGHGETGAEDVAERRKRRLRDHLGSTPGSFFLLSCFFS